MKIAYQWVRMLSVVQFVRLNMMVGSTTAPAEFLNEARCVSLHDEVTIRTHPTVGVVFDNELLMIWWVQQKLHRLSSLTKNSNGQIERWTKSEPTIIFKHTN